MEYDAWIPFTYFGYTRFTVKRTDKCFLALILYDSKSRTNFDKVFFNFKDVKGGYFWQNKRCANSISIFCNVIAEKVIKTAVKKFTKIKVSLIFIRTLKALFYINLN